MGASAAFVIPASFHSLDSRIRCAGSTARRLEARGVCPPAPLLLLPGQSNPLRRLDRSPVQGLWCVSAGSAPSPPRLRDHLPVAQDWMIDELAHAGAEHLDPGFVAAYDRKQAFDPAPDVAILLGCGLGAQSTLVDLGAGTGKLAKAAAAELGHVFAVDISPVMVGALERSVADSGLVNVECVRGGFLSYEHAGPPADAVYTRNALHQLPDFWKGVALERIAGILEPGGVLLVRDLIYDFRPREADAIFEQWFAGAAEDPTLGYTRADFVGHIRAEHSTYRWLFEPILTAAGFDIVDVEYRRSVYGAYTCVKR